jgi:hypothetical protein
MTARSTLILACVALAGCGASDRTPAASPVPVARTLEQHELALQLGNGFRAGLARLAVMEQPRDGATDLGQDLPAGLLRDVRCAARSGRWTCRVRWETPAGRPRATRYAVTLLRNGCFGAAATPKLADHFDPTINTYAEHPLNTIISVGKGC